MQFDINQIDRTELKRLNLIDNKGNILINKENIELLKSGKQTNDIELKGIPLKDQIVDLKASLSLYNSDKRTKIRIHPYYKQLENNQLLSERERKYISENPGVHNKHTNISGEILEHSQAKYKFDNKQQNSYYVKLKTESGTETVWGVNLQKELEDKKMGDKVTVKYTGKEKVNVNVPELQPDGTTKFKQITTDRNNFSVTPYNERNDYRNNRILVEFNKEKNSFEIVNNSRIPKVQAINGERITKEEQEQLERGEEITTKNGEKVKYSPKEQTFVQCNNNKLLIASLLIDGGISYLIIKAAERLANKENITKSQEHKQGVDKEYINELEKLKNEIDNKIRKTDDKKELTEIKDYINKEIDKVSVTPYQERDLEQRREDTLSNQVDDNEKKQDVDLPFDENLEIGKETDEIKHNDLLEDWEREEIERQEVEFNEQEQSEESESESQDISDDDAGGDEEEDEEQERSRGRSR